MKHSDLEEALLAAPAEFRTFVDDYGSVVGQGDIPEEDYDMAASIEETIEAMSARIHQLNKELKEWR